MESINVFVGIDIGGSHIGLSLFDDNNKILATYEEPLNPAISPETLVQRFDELISELQRQIKTKTVICSAGIGTPGQCKDGVLIAASNFPAWGRNIPLAAMLSSKLKSIPVALLNDADAAIAAEVWGTDNYSNIRHAAMISTGSIFLSMSLTHVIRRSSRDRHRAGAYFKWKIAFRR